MFRKIKKWIARMNNIELAIFGDNIVECERMFNLIKKAFPDYTEEKLDYSYIYAPKRRLINNCKSIIVHYYPDYKNNNRWHEKSILNELIEHGAILTEAPDIILTETLSENEYIILAIEFSSSIPAGNQAWQRSGRAMSLCDAQVPYLYSTEIGLEELDDKRNTKAMRTSNPLVPLSYIKNSQRTKSFTIIALNPSSLITTDDDINKYIIDDEVVNIIKCLILKQDVTRFLNKFETKTALYLDHYENTPGNISFKEWIEIDDNDIENFIKNFQLKKYNKKIAQKTPTKKEMLFLIKTILPTYALSIYNDLPICLIPSDNRDSFTNLLLSKCYPHLTSEVISWLKKEQPLVVCLINGFKPRGDDGRPDRGLVPFARMLFGNNIDLLTFVFGQAPQKMENLYANDPLKLADQNGLWKSILFYSSLTIADSIHWNLSNDKISVFQLQTESNDKNNKQIIISKPSQKPLKFNENDIDTAIHITFSLNENIFESLCNPPGGDWSGITLIDKGGVEHKWMSLPRVSSNAKRPDHIYQISYKNDNYIIIIESKESLNPLLKENNLGPALKKYLVDLSKYKSSAIKINNKWEKNERLLFELNITDYFTAAAFFCSNQNEIAKAKKQLKVDILIILDPNDSVLKFYPVNSKGSTMISVLNDIEIIKN